MFAGCRYRVWAVLLAIGLSVVSAAGEAPPLPAGLGDDESQGDRAPSLPAGLSETQPPLPQGLGAPAEAPAGQAERPGAEPFAELSGFWEIRGGVRTQHDKYQRDASIGETRLHLELQKLWKQATFSIKADLLYDAVVDRHRVRLESGDGLLDLREVSAAFSPTSFLDVKLGRQVLTWGTGDLIFINDMFPKDWRSFFIGRDVEYLKAPSDAIRLSFYGKLANVDVVYTPRFDPDRFIRGRRISYYSSTLGRRAGRDAIVKPHLPNDWFADDEWAVRIFKNVSGYELAAYGYWGYWKSPGGMNLATGRATFPRLGVYGASVRGQLGRGIANAEIGYYDSRQDRDGDDPYVNNSQLRLLFGYEQDLPQIARDLTVGVQYYLEWMMDYGAYERTLPAGSVRADEDRHVVTFRITKRLLNQNLTLSMFAYYSPTDADAYLRPKASYKIDDHWTAEIGANVFFGKYEHTFFGQFERDSNVYAALRYGF